MPRRRRLPHLGEVPQNRPHAVRSLRSDPWSETRSFATTSRAVRKGWDQEAVRGTPVSRRDWVPRPGGAEPSTPTADAVATASGPSSPPPSRPRPRSSRGASRKPTGSSRPHGRGRADPCRRPDRVRGGRERRQPRGERPGRAGAGGGRGARRPGRQAPHPGRRTRPRPRCERAGSRIVGGRRSPGSASRRCPSRPGSAPGRSRCRPTPKAAANPAIAGSAPAAAESRPTTS